LIDGRAADPCATRAAQKIKRRPSPTKRLRKCGAAARRCGPPTPDLARSLDAASRTSAHWRIFRSGASPGPVVGGRRALVHGPVRPGLAAPPPGCCCPGDASLAGRDPADPGQWQGPGRRGLGGGARPDPARVRWGPASASRSGPQGLLRDRRRPTAVRDALGRAAAVGFQRTPPSPSCCRTPTGRWSGSRTTGDADGDRVRQYCEDQATAWPTGLKDSWTGINFADGHRRAAHSRWGRGPGLRLCRVQPRGPSWGSAAGDQAGAGLWAQERPSSSSAPSTSGSGCPEPRLVRRRPGPRQSGPSDSLDLQQSATACGPASSDRRPRPASVPGTDVRRHVQRLGENPHAGPVDGRYNPDELP